jgi:hypothetical protein
MVMELDCYFSNVLLGMAIVIVAVVEVANHLYPMYKTIATSNG